MITDYTQLPQVQAVDLDPDLDWRAGAEIIVPAAVRSRPPGGVAAVNAPSTTALYPRRQTVALGSADTNVSPARPRGF